jgi:hypothetical protein
MQSICYYVSEMDAFVRRAFDHFKPEAFEDTFVSWYPDIVDVSYMSMNGIDTPTSLDESPDAPEEFFVRVTTNSVKLDELVQSPSWATTVIKPLDIPQPRPYQRLSREFPARR